MRARILSTASLLLALAGCGGPVLFAELEMPSVLVTLPQQTFLGTTLTTQTSTFNFDVGANVPIVNEPNVTVDLKLTRMTLVLDTANPANPANFDNVDSVTISALAPAGSGLPRLDLIRWERLGATGLTRIEAASATGADLTHYLTAGRIDVEASYTGSGLPTADWTADVSADFRIKVTLDYGAYL